MVPFPVNLLLVHASQRTRIGETIICAIERGDYDACGGDFYARGHIRAIAKAAGTDPGPWQPIPGH